MTETPQQSQQPQEQQSRTDAMEQKQQQLEKDEYGIVIDYIPPGIAENLEPEAIVIGERTFSILEVVLKEGEFVAIQDRLYIGSGKRDKVKYIKRRLGINELSSTAKAELEYAIKQIIQSREPEFVQFFNEAKPITPRRHELELIPGIGKRLMQRILEEREREPFKSFEDLEKRTGLKNVVDALAKRIIIELYGKDKHLLFVKVPPKTRLSRKRSRGPRGRVSRTPKDTKQQKT
jgi:putative nucleotide binding protein